MSTLDLISVIINGLSALLSAVAILLYLILYHRDKTSNNYDVFDNTYLEILKIGIEHPIMRNQNYTQEYDSDTSETRYRYEVYAFICWNFCETIFDKSDANLFKTWKVVIEEEARLHEKWILQKENRNKFKEQFIEYIYHKKYKSI